MSALVPKTKKEFQENKSLEDMLYETYETAERARIQADRNAGSILFNRALIMITGIVITAVAVNGRNHAKQVEDNLKNGIQLHIVPQYTPQVIVPFDPLDSLEDQPEFYQPAPKVDTVPTYTI